MGRHRFTLLDVFTSERLTGNALAVVHDADPLDAQTMLRFAREMRHSETSFVQTATEPGAHYRHRILMPTGEIPFAGHPSLGAAVAVARARGKRSVTYVQQTQAGLQPIDVEVDGDRARVSMLQEPAVFGDELDPEAVLGAVGLEGAEAHPDLPPQFVSTGAYQLLAPVRDAASLKRVWPNYDEIRRLLGPQSAITLYLVHVEDGRVRARSFTSSALVGEDAATGSAAGPLCAYVAQRTGVTGIEIVQGAEMGRHSLLRAAVEGDRVRVGGDAVVVIDGEVALDI